MTGHEEIEEARRLAGESSANDRFRLAETPGRQREYLPPLVQRDPFHVDAYTVTQQEIDELGGAATVNVPGREPGPSEFSHGRGMRPPVVLREPTLEDQLHVTMRTNPADPSAALDYEGADEERGYIPRVRETG